MMKHFTLSKLKCRRFTAVALLVFNTSCCADTGRPPAALQLSANSAENSYLTQILSGRSKDSIANCAMSDFDGNKYYVFMATMPGDVNFNKYLAAYARQKYKLILVNAGCKGYQGAFYYNDMMGALLSKTGLKPFGSIYLQAKREYNKKLAIF